MRGHGRSRSPERADPPARRPPRPDHRRAGGAGALRPRGRRCGPWPRPTAAATPPPASASSSGSLALPLAEARGVVKAFASYFQLVNLAEEQERVRVLHRREQEAHDSGSPMAETMRSALIELREPGRAAGGAPDPAGAPARDAGLHRPSHRGEAPHRAHQARAAWPRPSTPSTSTPPPPTRRGPRSCSLREEIVSLWQTDDTRTYRPSVLDEVRNGLYYFESTLFDLAPGDRAPPRRGPRRGLSRRVLRRCRPS